jgi:hypothetical protein
MSHLEDGTLHALLDGEIPSAELAPLEAHLSACAECRARLDAERTIRGEADGLVEILEAPAFAVTAGPPAQAALARPPRRWVRDVAWAASIVLAAGLGYASRGVRSAAPASQFGTARETSTPLPASPTAGISAPSPADSGATHQAAAGQSAPLGRLEARRERPAARRDAAPKLQEEKKALADKPDSVSRAKAAVAAPNEQLASKVAADVTGAPKERIAPAPVAAAPTAQAAGGVAGNLALRGARRLDTNAQIHLDEIVVTGVAENAAKARTPSPAAITFPDAIARLGGTIRLIEGLVPLRVEALGDRVRVIYPLAAGELVLEQWRSAGGVSWKLGAPAGFPRDSVERLTARVRE